MLNKLINSPVVFDSFVERERQKHLRQVQPVVPNQWIFERLDNYLQFSGKFEISLNSGELISSNGDYAHTYAGYSRVLGNPTSELAGAPLSYAYGTAKIGNFMTEDIVTLISPDSTLKEQATAALFTVLSQLKLQIIL